jgi:hypothetical protein
MKPIINSMFTITGDVLKTFVQVGQVDKETGVQAPSSVKVQILGEMPVMGGDSRNELVSLTVENQQVYEQLIGKRIRVPLGFFSPQKGNIIYFIPKGSKPEIVLPLDTTKVT